LRRSKSDFFVPHHRSHAAAAFYPSPFDEAAVLVVDGVGEWSTTSLWNGSGDQLTPLGKILFPNSLGMFYSAFAPYCGFKVNFGEYKLILDRVIDLKPDGSFQLDISFFRFDTNVSVISPLFEALFGQPTRRPEAPLE
jgi:carbamoyltransferase